MSDEAVLYLIDALEGLGVPYMIVGSFSSNLYGIPRSTKDADFVVHFEKESLAALRARLAPRLRLDPQATFEGVTLTTKYVVFCPDTPFSIELFLLSSDPHDQARFQRRRAENLLGRSVFVPTVEDVIITKLLWYMLQGRPKDREDIFNVIGVQRGKIDWPYVHSWCDQHGTRQLLDEIVQSVPEI